MSANSIDIRALTYAWPETDVPTLRAMDWSVGAGEFALLIGRSGSGKSTLLRALNGLVPHFSGGTFGGRVSVHGLDTRQYPPRDMARHVGFVFQDPEAQLLTNRVVDDIAFSMEQMAIAPAIMRKRVEEMLDLVGIAHLRDRDPGTLSGGERQRVAIASALALHPSVLALDEPTSQLDPWSAEAVISALTRINEDLGITIVMAEHRLERVLSHADNVRLLADDGTPTDGTASEIAQIVAPVALPPVAQIGRAFSWNSIPLTVKQARMHPEILSLRSRLENATEPVLASPATGDVVMELENVAVTLGSNRIVRDASMKVHQGEMVALMGRNGSGKTTLLRAMMGFVPVAHGRISIGSDLVAAGQSGSKGIGYVPQRSGSIFFSESLREEVAFTARKRGVDVDPRALLAEVDLEWAIDRHPSTLSVGERQRAAIAVVLAGQPDVLLLDEPTRGMDPWHKHQLAAVLRRLQDRGLAIVMATHDIELAANLADQVVMLGDGGIVAAGRPGQILIDSLTFSTQMNLLFGNRWLTVGEVLAALGHDHDQYRPR